VLKSLERFFEERNGFEVVGLAGTGTEAVREVGRPKADLVGMDIRMPEMDGLEATRRIKAGEGAPVVIVFTLENNLAARAGANQAGADDFVPKAPNVYKALGAALRRAHPRARGSVRWSAILPRDEVIMAKNYYLILGITEDASGEEIKAAYRQRAMELHPDRSGRERGPFQEVQEAYSVLGDPERRRRYDRERPRPAATRGRRGRGAEPLVPEPPAAEPFRPVESARGFRELAPLESFETCAPSFEELFERFWSNFEPCGRPKAERLESLTVEVVISPEEARLGSRVRVRIPARARCTACGGRGSVGFYECWRCEGHGALVTEYPVEVSVAPGTRDGDAVRIALTRFGIENSYLTLLFRVSGVGL
jgi:molecular chaperone DnaJ